MRKCERVTTRGRREMTGDPVDVYGLIAKRLLKGKVVPVLGAGVNLCERPPDAGFKPGRYLPSGPELAAGLARDYPLIKTRDLAPEIGGDSGGGKGEVTVGARAIKKKKRG